jgi:adenine-specific DNA methylase
LEALLRAGFRITAAHPIKAEMSVAQPKALAKEPIDLDIILVCRKRDPVTVMPEGDAGLWPDVEEVASHQLARLTKRGRKLSRNDVRVVVMAQLLRRLSATSTVDGAMARLAAEIGEADAIIGRLHRSMATA